MGIVRLTYSDLGGCTICGAAVWSEEAHNAWHLKQGEQYQAADAADDTVTDTLTNEDLN